MIATRARWRARARAARCSVRRPSELERVERNAAVETWPEVSSLGFRRRFSWRRRFFLQEQCLRSCNAAATSHDGCAGSKRIWRMLRLAARPSADASRPPPAGRVASSRAASAALHQAPAPRHQHLVDLGVAAALGADGGGECGCRGMQCGMAHPTSEVALCGTVVYHRGTAERSDLVGAHVRHAHRLPGT